MTPEYVTWTDPFRGQVTQITAPTKYAILEEYARRYNLKNFVETGTCNGDCQMRLASLFEHCWTIELDRAQYEWARAKLASFRHVKLIHGDSAVELEKLLSEVEGPALFWLDAHMENWKGPIVKEVSDVFASGVKGAILVDDMDYITDVLPEDPRWRRSEEYGIVRFVSNELA